jgi:hypothetical protein
LADAIDADLDDGRLPDLETYWFYKCLRRIGGRVCRIRDGVGSRPERCREQCDPLLPTLDLGLRDQAVGVHEPLVENRCRYAMSWTRRGYRGKPTTQPTPGMAPCPVRGALISRAMMLINHADSESWSGLCCCSNWQMQVVTVRPIFGGCFLGGLDVR